MSLLELTLVLLIFAILAAMAMPGIARMRMAANETSTIGTLRTIYNANIGYAQACSSVGFASSIAELNAGTTCPAGAGFLDVATATELNGTGKAGYKFAYTTVQSGDGTYTTFTLTAIPATVGTTGIRGFRIDETGVLRYTNTGTAPTSGSPYMQ